MEVEEPGFRVHIVIDDGEGLCRDGEGYGAVRLFLVSRFGSDILHHGLFAEVV